jgi:hypothetical protein
MEVYESSLSGVLRIILWLILISFLIRLIARLALPVVIKKADQAMRDRAAAYQSQNQPPRPEGQVTVEKSNGGSGKKADGGDYVDYVEIRD